MEAVLAGVAGAAITVLVGMGAILWRAGGIVASFRQLKRDFTAVNSANRQAHAALHQRQDEMELRTADMNAEHNRRIGKLEGEIRRK